MNEITILNKQLSKEKYILELKTVDNVMNHNNYIL